MKHLVNSVITGLFLTMISTSGYIEMLSNTKPSALITLAEHMNKGLRAFRNVERLRELADEKGEQTYE